jgi:putative ABC transport system permease protein
MLTLTVKSIRANVARFVLTSVAVVLGVAFMAGTLVLTDTIERSYDDLATHAYESTDAVVRSARHVTSPDDGRAVRGTVPASLLDAVRAVDGVKVAEPQLLGIAAVVARDGRLLDANPNRAVPVALGWQSDPGLNPLELVAGHEPRHPNEVVIDRMSQRRGGFAVGDVVRVVGASGSHEYELVGVATYGGADSAAGAQVVAFAPQTAAAVFGTPGRYSAIQVVAAPGWSQEEVVANIAAVLGDGVEVVTGATAAEEARAAAGGALMFVDVFLLVFAVVALVVGAFVIYNTFSITVAQRTRETALLRAIGAKRRQVMRSVRLEALFVGVFASAVGVVAGIGAARGLRAVLGAFGLDLPATDSVVRARTIVVSTVTGVIVTLGAAHFPARRAAKVAPIEALRAGAVDTSPGSRRRAVVGSLTVVAGALLIARGLAGAGAGPVGSGALAVFVGVATLGPAIARPFTRAIGAPLPPLRGITGALARENAARNPRRTSATASALMIGVGLVTLITVFAASARASISTSIDTAWRGDYIVDTQFGMGGLAPDVARQIDELPETGAVTPVRYLSAEVGGSAEEISAFDVRTVDRNMHLDVRSGTAVLGADEIAVQRREAADHDIHVGDTLPVFFPETGTRDMRVAAIYATDVPFGPYAISLAAYDAHVASRVDKFVMVSRAPGASMAETRRAVERVLDAHPNATLRTKEEFKGAFAAEIAKSLNMVYVLLAMALVIAFFGIANALALSVLERTPEIGLLRAVGTSRAQVRATVRWEAVLVALLGTALGTVIGLGFGWALVQALRDEGFRLAVPAGRLALVTGVAAVAAVVAAALPARRAARLEVLRAIGP